jgi:ribosome maturation factor RimP
MPLKTKEEMIAAVERIAETVVRAAGLELFEVELKGAGRSHYLRVYIDKPMNQPGAHLTPPELSALEATAPDVTDAGPAQLGVTHEDCELVSREMSALLDAEDPIPGTYSLEVSSPGVERPLKRWKDWERFRGHKAKVVLSEPLEDTKLKTFDGIIAETSEADQTLTLDVGKGRTVTFPFALVSKAHLKFEW